jgi:hypothetical protein
VLADDLFVVRLEDWTGLVLSFGVKLLVIRAITWHVNDSLKDKTYK